MRVKVNYVTKFRKSLILSAILIYIVLLLPLTYQAYGENNKEDTSTIVSEIDQIDEKELPESIETEQSENENKVDSFIETLEPAVLNNEIIRVYHVQSGDTLWAIAEKAYGNGCFYPFIMETNEMETEYIHVDQELYIDAIPEYEKDSILKTCYEKIDQMEAEQILNSKSSSQATNNSVPSKDGMTYVGKFKITGYDAWCTHCCSGTGLTASGKYATVGKTVATSKQFPFGTKLYIEGLGTYVVEDRGVGDHVIDIATDSHEACATVTNISGANVYIVN